MRCRRVLLTLAAIAALNPRTCDARWEGIPEGVPNFDVGILPRPPQLPDTSSYTLVVKAANYYRQQSGEGTVRISLPNGLRLVKGELLHEIRFGTMERSDRYWTIDVKPQRPGMYSIRSHMTVKLGGDYIEEGVCEASVYLSAASVGGGNKPIWWERRFAGKRFAYAEKYQVLLEEDEKPLWEPIDEPPTPKHVTEGTCLNCPCDTTVIVPIVFTVGRNGQLRWIRPAHPHSVNADVEAAAVKALESWTYRPAKAGGKRVSYWATADVPVRCSN